MAFDVYFAARRMQRRAPGKLARGAVDLVLACFVVGVVIHFGLRLTITRVEAPPLPPERDLDAEAAAMIDDMPRPRVGCGGGWPESGDDEEEEIPDEEIPFESDQPGSKW